MHGRRREGAPEALVLTNSACEAYSVSSLRRTAVRKPGDIVKVEVMRRRTRARTARTMRLSEGPGEAVVRVEKNARALGETAPRQAASASPGGALAEALRRAGLRDKGWIPAGVPTKRQRQSFAAPPRLG